MNFVAIAIVSIIGTIAANLEGLDIVADTILRTVIRAVALSLEELLVVTIA